MNPFAAAILAAGLVLLGAQVERGLRAYACGSNPYLAFCGAWVRDVPR